MIYITTGATTTLPLANGIHIEVNAALTGTITVKDGSNTVAVMTNPGITSKDYYGFAGVPSIVTSTTCDVTVSILQNNR